MRIAPLNAHFHSLDTSRLTIRRFQEGDVEAFLAYRNDPQVAKYQGWKDVNADRARIFIQELQAVEPGQPGEWFQFAFEIKSDRRLVGDCGLFIEAGDPRLGEIGYSLARPYQGLGLAAEGVGCILDFAFGSLSLHRLVARTDTENFASIRLLERLRFRREAYFVQNYWSGDRWTDEYLYALLEIEWGLSTDR